MLRSLRTLRLYLVTNTRWTCKAVIWSPSYFAASCGGALIAIVRQYIENQPRASTRP
ncbi:transposase [Bradyrhizobium tropiciagri]|uniref:transposase n=1 Tax=Bradyrhizobium tropiciagri TaxID=312253 RepID=UPI0032E03574